MTVSRAKIMTGLIGAASVSIALSACSTPPTTKVEHKSDADMTGKVQSLQKQIQERDRHIEEQDKRIGELESQLESLKLIDQDRENQRKPFRPPTTIEPVQ